MSDPDLRRRLFGVAYRMTGSVSDAEEIVQEALLTATRAEAEGVDVRSRPAFLTTVTTRLAIDHLRSARVQRETYVGPWLPEPLVTDPAPGPAETVERDDMLSQALLVVLETLTPVERAVFLLREAFGYAYAEIAAIVHRSEEHCRQIGARARRHVEARRPRFDPDPDQGQLLLARFLAACDEGDTAALTAMLADDATLFSDGGGEVVAARRPILGADRVARFMAGVTRQRRARGEPLTLHATVNGRPGCVIVEDGVVSNVLALDIHDGRVQRVHIVRNPAKLRHVAPERLASRPSGDA